MQISSLSCPTTHACVAVDSAGGYALVGDPTGGTWSASRLDFSQGLPGDPPDLVTGVSCEPTGRCVAVDGVGNAFLGTLTGLS